MACNNNNNNNVDYCLPIGQFFPNMGPSGPHLTFKIWGLIEFIVCMPFHSRE